MHPPSPPSLPGDLSSGPFLDQEWYPTFPSHPHQKSCYILDSAWSKQRREAGQEAEEEGDGMLTRPPRQPASKSSTLSKWGVDPNPLGFWRPRQPSETRGRGRGGLARSRPLWHRSPHSRRKSLQQLSSVPLFPPLPLPLPAPPSPSPRTPRPTVPGTAAALPVRPFRGGTAEPWRGANWICCHLPKLPGAHVCSGYR